MVTYRSTTSLPASEQISEWSETSRHPSPFDSGVDPMPKVWSSSLPMPMGRPSNGRLNAGSSWPLRSAVEECSSQSSLVAKTTIPLVDRGISRLVAPTPGDAVDVLSGCRAVVGVDTGLTHIAAQQGTPTITLCRTPAVYFRDWDHTRLVAGSACDPVCQRDEKEYAYNHRVNFGTRHPSPRVCRGNGGVPGRDRARRGHDGPRRALLIDSLPLSRAVNSQPAGIGRVVSLGSGCAWNNLGRNVVFADAFLNPLAIFGDTLFPEDDETSQFDLDVHAIVDLPDTGQVAVLNHLGSVRIFEPPPSRRPGLDVGPDLKEVRRLDFLDDIERVVGLGSQLVTSRPRGQRLGGVLVTQPVATSRQRLDADLAQESFGFVTALAASSTSDDKRMGRARR